MIDKKVLIVDDEEDMRNLVSIYLENSGMKCVEAADGKEAFNQLENHDVDLILLDVMMPNLDGFAFCEEVRKESSIPIIFLTARGDEWDKVKGLRLGGDDYIVKPFSPGELVARIEAVLRRIENQATPSDIEKFGPIEINDKARKVKINGEQIDLTLKEYDLLVLLCRHDGQVFSREQLLERVWGYDYNGSARTVDTHIKTLRLKLKDEGERIQTVWGIGYKFEV